MVKSITFVFENCESIDIPVRYIGLIHIGDICTEINRVASNSIKKCNVAKEFFIEIFSEGDVEYYGYFRCSKFERLLKSRDIKYIDILYENNTTETIYFEYSGNSQNEYQDIWLSRLGNLYISISRKKLVDDFILEKDANSEVQVNLRKGVVSRDKD